MMSASAKTGERVAPTMTAERFSSGHFNQGQCPCRCHVSNCQRRTKEFKVEAAWLLDEGDQAATALALDQLFCPFLSAAPHAMLMKSSLPVPEPAMKALLFAAVIGSILATPVVSASEGILNDPASTNAVSIWSIKTDLSAHKMMIYGKNFGTDSPPQVTVNGTEVTVLNASDTEVEVAIPSDLEAASYRVVLYPLNRLGHRSSPDVFEAAAVTPTPAVASHFTVGDYGPAVCARSVTPAPGACPDGYSAVGIGGVRFGDATGCQSDAHGDVPLVQVAPLCVQ